MHVTNQILSDITTHMKYAKFIPEKLRREDWNELVTRNVNMHVAANPHMEVVIREAYKYVYSKKVLPSMRSLQFGGAPIELNPSRIYNCAYAPVDSPAVFSEAMFLLLGGTGLGFSVQTRHVEKLPEVRGPRGSHRRYLVGDSIEGWADAIKVLVESHFEGRSPVRLDFRDIRPKGARLITSGGKAPGPGPLKECTVQIDKMLSKAQGRKLRPIEAHDIMCVIADAVLAGGIRRAALISLFSKEDKEMLTSKSGAWWEETPYRGRANNSVTLDRATTTEAEFKEIWQAVEDSMAGEPGVYWSNDLDMGTNPCCEVAMRAHNFCNLCEINASDIESQEDLNQRAWAASVIGTCQASFTDFHYLRPVWKETTEEDALIGVGMTGIGSGAILEYNLEEAADVVKQTNLIMANALGINAAKRCNVVKPSGTSSLVLGSSSGVHAWHNTHYLRRIRVGKNEAIYQYISANHPELVVDDESRPDTQAIFEIPQAAPENSILRTEAPLELLERVRRFNTEWVHKGHRTGNNTHNVSCTISLKPDEWAECGAWMWEHRHDYNGISVLNYDGGSYVQAPFEDITEEEFNARVPHLHALDLTQVVEMDDNTDLTGEAACAGGACEVI
mgnify:CR=1 FL=1